jgi:hypothetical protein
MGWWMAFVELTWNDTMESSHLVRMKVSFEAEGIISGSIREESHVHVQKLFPARVRTDRQTDRHTMSFHVSSTNFGNFFHHPILEFADFLLYEYLEYIMGKCQI